MGPYVKVRRRTHRKLPDRLPSGPTKVKVGFPSGKVDGDIIMRAVYNHFGTSGSGKGFSTPRGGGFGGPIPERPFLANAIRDNRGKYKRQMHVAAAAILSGDRTIRSVLMLLGQSAQDDIKREIRTLSSPPNSPVTIALKGSSNPLVDSGDMGGNVRFKIDD